MGPRHLARHNAPVQPLGVNRGSYLGERLDVAAFLAVFRAHANATGWSVESIPAGADRRLCMAHRAARQRDAKPLRRLYLSSGVHGDEPAGPLALLDLIRSDRFPDNAEIWMCPCLNPAGLEAGTRTNPEGIDLNRDYNHRRSHEVQAHLGWLEACPSFDLGVMLHEDWEAAGFYLYELNPDQLPSRSAHIIRNVSKVCPIETATLIDGRPSDGSGVICPPTDPTARPDWPEAFWLLQNRCRQSLTLEAPSDFALATRVAALSAAVHCAFQREDS